jgi:FeS assembly protein IscX
MQINICIIQLTVADLNAIIFTIMAETLHWESTYAIALALKAEHPNVDMESVSLRMILAWTLALSNFKDDPALAHDDILLAIYQDWFEEIL